MSQFLNAVRKRRSIYNLGNKLEIPDMEFELMLAQIIKDCPTAFNMQSSRMVVLRGENHKKLWEITWKCLRETTPAEKLTKTKAKLDTFEAGAGTILFFNDNGITDSFAKQYTTYEKLFPDWALEQNGMLQFTVWTALADKGVGASLQHYNPLIDCDVKKQFNIPGEWCLLAEMPFGNITAPPEEKEFAPIEERLRFM